MSSRNMSPVWRRLIWWVNYLFFPELAVNSRYWVVSKQDSCDAILEGSEPDMIFVKSFTQARFQQIWKFTPITRKPRHVLPPKTPFKSKQMWDSPTVLLRYALSLLYNIKLIKNYTKIFKITQDMSSPAEILPNIEIIYTSAACDACDKYHVCCWRADAGLGLVLPK